ncbi:MAG: type IV secretion system family protein [Proteobacteria bacterium]|nr:type IV secretion system family protein [Pseudomonadota bacterium]
MTRSRKISVAVAAVLLATGLPAQATVPVIDVAAIMQMIQQIMAWEQQLEGMRMQLEQLQQTKSALTGSRGMAQLLPISVAARNYLPADLAALSDVASVAVGTGAAVAHEARSRLAANAVLSGTDLQRLSPQLQALLATDRQSVAASQALSRLAYSHSSDRFASLSTLIDQIRATPDAKAIAELQGRIEAEQAMLANEGIKLSALAQSAEADRSARELARREAVVQGHGSFATRFQPKTPVP